MARTRGEWRGREGVPQGYEASDCASILQRIACSLDTRLSQQYDDFMSRTERPLIRFDIWWLLTFLIAAATIVVAILEALGVFKDLGIALGFIGITLTMIFGLMTATRASARELREDLTDLRVELSAKLDQGFASVTTSIERLRDDIRQLLSK